MCLSQFVNPPLDDLNTLQVRARIAFDTRVFVRDREEPQRLDRFFKGSTHRNAGFVGLGYSVWTLAQILGQSVAAKETHCRTGTTGGVGFLSAQGFEDRVPRVLFRPDHGMATRIGIEVILNIAKLGISPSQVARIVLLIRTTRQGGVRIRTAYDTHHKGIDALVLPVGQSILVGIAHHVAACKVF